MPENKNSKIDFSNFGQESFNLDKDKNARQEAIVLNIQEEESPSQTLIENLAEKNPNSGNFFFDLYHKANLYLIKKTKIKVEVKSNFFHLLSVMINAGIPMVKALKSLAIQSEETPRMKIICEELAEDIVAGARLSNSMELYTDVFTEQEIGMIQAGEVSGQLSKVLEILAHDAEKSTSIRKKVKSALMYPAVIFTLLIAVIIIMLVYVIPKLTELFAATEGQLPLITRIIVGMSNFLIEKKFTLFIAVLSVILFIMLFRRTQKGKYFFAMVQIKMPVFGILFKKTFLSRFARSLSNLLDSSVSIIKTLEITAKSIGNEVYKKRILLSIEDIKQGIPLAENLSESELFPPMMVSMIEVGEKTAQLDTITAKIADFYENEVDTMVSGISKIIEPIMLIIIGLTVGAVVAAIILPIMQLSNLAGSL